MYLGVDDAHIFSEVGSDVTTINKQVLVPLKMVPWLRQQATSKPHRVPGMHRLVLRTICYDRWMR